MQCKRLFARAVRGSHQLWRVAVMVPHFSHVFTLTRGPSQWSSVPFSKWHTVPGKPGVPGKMMSLRAPNDQRPVVDKTLSYVSWSVLSSSVVMVRPSLTWLGKEVARSTDVTRNLPVWASDVTHEPQSALHDHELPSVSRFTVWRHKHVITLSWCRRQ